MRTARSKPSFTKSTFSDRLVTGQNPASATGVAEQMLALLEAR